MKLILEAKDENLEKINQSVHSILGSNCDETILNFIDLAVEEIFVNICHYAYEGKTGEAEVRINYENKILEIIFIDSGKEFNPLNKKDPDLTLSAEDREIGGLGIFLTKKYMDSVNYEYRAGNNILRITKAIQ